MLYSSDTSLELDARTISEERARGIARACPVPTASERIRAARRVRTIYGDTATIVGKVDGYPAYVEIELINPFNGRLIRIPIRTEFLSPLTSA